MRPLLPLLSCLLLAACAAPQEKPATIGELAANAEDEKAQELEQVKPPAGSGGRREAIRAYRRYLERATDPELRAQAMRRLADLQLEETEELAAQGDESQQHTSAAAIELYRALLKDYPDHPRNDHVLYQLSRAHDYQRQPQAAMAALDRLVSEYPDSGLIAEAQFRRGETLFAERDFAAAEQAYRAVLGLGEQTLYYQQALYKLAWSLYRQSQFEQSIGYFMDLLELHAVDGRIDVEALAGAERERSEDALRAVALSFSNLEGAEAVSRWFREHGGRDDEQVIYARLASQYLEQERYTDAAETFRAFVARHRTHERAPDFQLKVVKAYRQGDFPSQVLLAKREYVHLFGLESPFWAERGREDRPDVVEQLEQNLIDLARHYHAAFQDRGDAETFSQAAAWYRHYLASFPKASHSQKMHFMLAELLFEHGRYAEAIRHYQHSAYDFDDNERAATAAYAALLAYEHGAEQLEGAELRDWEGQHLKSARRFSERFQEHEQAPTVLAHAIQRHFDRGEGSLAASAAERLLARYPQAPAQFRLSAWSVLGHVRFDEGEYPAAEQAYAQALQQPQLSAERKQALTQAMAAAVYRHGEDLREQGDEQAAVAEFRRVPDSDIKPVASYDAGSLLMSMERWGEAAEVLEELRARYPQHRLQAQVTEKLAVAYVEAGQPRSAAAEFRRIARSDRDTEVRQEALERAAELYRQAGDDELEEQTLKAYVDAFPEPLEPMLEARQRLIELYDEQGRTRPLRGEREALIAAERAAGQASTQRSRYLAAQASLALAKEAHAAYARMRLSHPLERSLERKRELMEAALAAFDAAADYRVASVTTAATFHSAEIYAQFARALLESERPDDLDSQALAEYDFLLEEQAYPFEEQAIEIHEVNARRARRGVFNEWVQSSYERLAELMPARYHRPERSERFVSSME